MTKDEEKKIRELHMATRHLEKEVADVLSTLTTRYAIEAVVLVKQKVSDIENDFYEFLEQNT